MDTVTTKQCSRCGEEKPLDAFYRARNMLQGRHSMCKPCFLARKRERAGKLQRTEKQCGRCGTLRPVEDFTLDRTTADGRRNECRACQAHHHAKSSRAGVRSRVHAPLRRIGLKRCPDCAEVLPLDHFTLERGKRVRRTPYCKLCKAARYAAYIRRPEKRPMINATNAQWRREHRDRANIISRGKKARRRARRGEGRITTEQWRALLEVFDHRCAYCLRRCEHLTMDHVIAVSRGGTHEPSNVVPCCRECNVRKAARPVFMMARAA